MNDLVVKSQAIDIIGLILSLIKRKTSLTTSRRPRKSSFGCSHYPRVIGLPLNSMESDFFKYILFPLYKRGSLIFLSGGVSIELITFALLSESQWLHEAHQLN